MGFLAYSMPLFFLTVTVESQRHSHEIGLASVLSF